MATRKYDLTAEIESARRGNMAPLLECLKDASMAKQVESRPTTEDFQVPEDDRWLQIQAAYAESRLTDAQMSKVYETLGVPV